jgi:hypothetical protein
MNSTRKQIKETFVAAFPGVKCTFDNQTVVPSFVYQDGPAIEKVQALLAPFGIQIIRVINANLLGFTAQAYLKKYVNTDNSFARRGIIEGYIVPDSLCSLEEKAQATAYAQSLDASTMEAIVQVATH